jgi:uncharacterized protein YciI
MDVPLTRRWVLFYDYETENLVERRAPHRPAHIGLVREWMADGRLLHGGAVGDPPHGGLLVFAVEDAAAVEEFVAQDPYVSNGIVTGHRIEPWNVVS